MAEERRLVTVLFADMTGSTALGEARSGVVTLESDPRLSEELAEDEQVSALEAVFEDLARRAAGSDYRVLLVALAAVVGGSAIYLVTRREPVTAAEVSPLVVD